MLVDKYKIKLTLTREMLGTNPCDPHILDVHILDKQRKLILEKGGINTQINKYLAQIPISKEKGEAEIQKLIDKLEELIGYKLTEEERSDAIAGKLESLKETLQEMDIKGTTVFFWDKEKNLPCISSHMVLGYLKGASEAIGRTMERKAGKVLHSISYTQSLINQHVRIEQQFLTFDKDILRNEDGKPNYLQRSLRAMTAQGPRISLAKSEQVPAGASLTFVMKVLGNSDITEDVLKTLFDYGEFVGLGQWRSAAFGMFSYEINKL